MKPIDVYNNRQRHTMRKMTLNVRVNEEEMEVEAWLDDCSFYTILNEYPDEEEMMDYTALTLDSGGEKIFGKVFTSPIYFNGTLSTDNVLYVEDYPTNVIGWHQLKDLGLLKINPHRKHVIDAPPALIDSGAEPGYASEKYVKRDLIGDAKRVIASWVRKGIIERCHSPCNSPVTLTTKSNGKVKIVFDYFHLNRDVTPEPFPRDQGRNQVVSSVPLGKYYSVLKLYYGEWQIPLDTMCKYKTAFTFLGQQYVWNRLPGKYRNTTAILGKTLGRVLDNLPQNVRKHIIHFVDVMLLSMDTKEACRRYTDLLWSHLEDHGFVMQQTNNQICQSQVTFLGREINPEGICLSEDYLQKVREVRPPKSLSDLWSILSMLGDARRFTPGFGVYAAELYKLRSKKKNWLWERRHQALLDALLQQILQNRMVVPGIREEGACVVQVFIIDDAWMAEVCNSARKPYLSASGEFRLLKKPEPKAVKELKAMKEVWGSIRHELKDRAVLWEVECPEVASYRKDRGSLDVNKKLDLSFICSPQHTIKVVHPSSRKLPIHWPV